MDNPKSKIGMPSGRAQLATSIAVIGAGAMGRNHLRVLNDMPLARLVGVADADEVTAQRSARVYGIKPYTDYRHLLDHEKPEAVVIAVPTVMHRDVALNVISRGIHLLVEK